MIDKSATEEAAAVSELADRLYRIAWAWGTPGDPGEFGPKNVHFRFFSQQAREVYDWMVAHFEDRRDEHERIHMAVVWQRDRLLRAAHQALSRHMIENDTDADAHLRSLVHLIQQEMAAMDNGDQPARTWEVPPSPDDVEALEAADGNVWFPHPDKPGVWHRPPNRLPDEGPWIERKWLDLFTGSGPLRATEAPGVDGALRRLRERLASPEPFRPMREREFEDIRALVDYVAANRAVHNATRRPQ